MDTKLRKKASPQIRNSATPASTLSAIAQARIYASPQLRKSASLWIFSVLDNLKYWDEIVLQMIFWHLTFLVYLLFDNKRCKYKENDYC